MSRSIPGFDMQTVSSADLQIYPMKQLLDVKHYS